MPRAPISSTRYRVAGSARSTVSGSPSSLLKEPWVATVGAGVGEHRGEQVLGAGLALRPGDREHRTAAATHAAAPAPAGQRLRAPLDVVDHDGRARRWAGSPARRRAGRDRGRRVVVAVDVLAGERHEQPARLDRLAAVDERGPGDRSASSPSRRAADDRGDLGEPERDQRRSPDDSSRRTSRSSNGCTTPSTSWPVSWPLPATRTVSPAASAIARRSAIARGGRRPRCTSARRVGRHAGQHRGADRGRVLGARVVVGDHQHVGEPGGDLAHQRPLAGVAVAAGAEDDDQPARGQRAQRVQRGRDGVGLVGVVDDRRGSPGRRRRAPAGRARPRRRRCRRRPPPGRARPRPPRRSRRGRWRR